MGPRPMCGVSWLGYGGRFVLRDDWESSQAALLRVEARHEGVEAIITVEGELDHSTVERFVARILEALDTKPRSITVDAPAVTFTDSSGLSALLQARGLAFVDHVAFRIRDPLPRLRRPVEASGIEDLPLPDERWPPSPRGAATWRLAEPGGRTVRLWGERTCSRSMVSRVPALPPASCRFHPGETGWRAARRTAATRGEPGTPASPRHVPTPAPRDGSAAV